MGEEKEEKALEPFVRHGTKEERIEVAADEVLNAIAEGRNVNVQHAVIKGDLDIRKIEDRLVRGGDGNLTVHFFIAIVESWIIGDANFCGTAFSIGPFFTETTFFGDADFHRATFSQTTTFWRAAFNKDATFERATFSGDAVFSQTTFFGDANFREATFSRDATFQETTFSRAAYFTQTIMEHPANFWRVRFYKNTVSVGLWNHILCPTIRRLSKGKVSLKEKLVTNFLGFKTSVMDGSTNPYLKRYIDDEQWIASWRECAGKWGHFLFTGWELTSHCGRSIWLWAGWSVFFAFLFALAYTPSPNWMPERWCAFWQRHGAEFEQMTDAYANEPMGFWSSFYFSIVTFTTLGFGDVATANTFARFLVTLEVVLGYIMLGGLISIFANKLARRA